MSDIVDNLTTNVVNKPLSASQGVALKMLIDTLTIPTKLSELSEDVTHRTVTDAEKAEWNGKSNFSGSYNDLTDKPTKLSNFENDLFYKKMVPFLTLKKEDFLSAEENHAFLYESSPSLSWFSEAGDISFKLNITTDGKTTSMTSDEDVNKRFLKEGPIEDGSYLIIYIFSNVAIVNNYSLKNESPADAFGITLHFGETVPDDFSIEIYRVEEKRLTDDFLPKNLKEVIDCQATTIDSDKRTYSTDIDVSKFASKIIANCQKYEVHINSIYIGNEEFSVHLHNGEYSNEDTVFFSGTIKPKGGFKEPYHVHAYLYCSEDTDGNNYVELKLVTTYSGMQGNTITFEQDTSAAGVNLENYKKFRMLVVYIDALNNAKNTMSFNFYNKTEGSDIHKFGFTVNNSNMVENFVCAILFNANENQNFLTAFYSNCNYDAEYYQSLNPGTYIRKGSYWSMINLGTVSAGTTVRIEAFE